MSNKEDLDDEQEEKPRRKVGKRKSKRVKTSVFKTLFFFLGITVLNLPSLLVTLGLMLILSTNKVSFMLPSKIGFSVVIGLPILVCSPVYLMGYLMGNKLGFLNKRLFGFNVCVVFTLVYATYWFVSFNYL